jgi:hypothetical protein
MEDEIDYFVSMPLNCFGEEFCNAYVGQDEMTTSLGNYLDRRLLMRLITSFPCI